MKMVIVTFSTIGGGGCKSDEFRCRSGVPKLGESFKLGSRTYVGGCVPDYYACDGYFDCNDGSDEDATIDEVAAKCSDDDYY